MNRTLKQIVYSFAYLVLFILIGSLIWGWLTKEDPTCNDGIQNQTETGIDCGGSCISCDLKNIELPEFLGYSAMSLKSGRVSFLFHIKNPNSTHHASPFSYTIHLFDENNIERETFSGSTSLGAGEDGYIYEGAGSYRDPKSVTMEVTDVTWKLVDAFSLPRLSVVDVQTSVENGVVRVKGQIENMSSFDAENVHIIAVLTGEYNEDIYASQMVLTRARALGREQFSVIFPNDQEIVKRLKTNQTRVIVQSE